MFQYIKRNILRRGVSPNNDFGFLADQLLEQANHNFSYPASHKLCEHGGWASM